MKKYILKIKQYEYGKEPNCEECNWDSCVIAELRDAKTNERVSGRLCGQCMVETLANCDAVIVFPAPKGVKAGQLY
jgi:transcription elongation factor Elf1